MPSASEQLFSAYFQALPGKYTQADLARAFDTSQPRVSTWKRGLVRIPADVLVELVERAGGDLTAWLVALEAQYAEGSPLADAWRVALEAVGGLPEPQSVAPVKLDTTFYNVKDMAADAGINAFNAYEREKAEDAARKAERDRKYYEAVKPVAGEDFEVSRQRLNDYIAKRAAHEEEKRLAVLRTRVERMDANAKQAIENLMSEARRLAKVPAPGESAQEHRRRCDAVDACETWEDAVTMALVPLTDIELNGLKILAETARKRCTGAVQLRTDAASDLDRAGVQPLT